MASAAMLVLGVPSPGDPRLLRFPLLAGLTLAFNAVIAGNHFRRGSLARGYDTSLVALIFTAIALFAVAVGGVADWGLFSGLGFAFLVIALPVASRLMHSPGSRR